MVEHARPPGLKGVTPSVMGKDVIFAETSTWRLACTPTTADPAGPEEPTTGAASSNDGGPRL
jgi:hypothetical protein